ncbi:hypothetical protein AMS68_002795 [Peltaster fructicola]|uniref:Ribosomal protein/NADH dehydrogenase domain-containing protein n=1 Tax=Peltaster fructicola TaxID=286661 RepID=A0A6H0XRL0_9PEZI|nr:hypothetical protein AMS68_002795 [Peltaster fructicola]
MPVNSIGRRIIHVQQRLLDIRTGTGALLLPKTIKRIHLRFAPHINGGHMGPRKFWRNELIRLKYHNPAVPMSVDNKAPQEEKAIMSIHFTAADAKQSSDSPTSSPAAIDSTTQNSTPSDAASTERVETIDMTGYTNTEILDALVKLTKATVVEPTPEDIAEAQMLEEDRIRSAREAKIGLAIRTRQKREKQLLEQARGDFV